MSTIVSTVVQGWIGTAVQGGLSPRSVRKYHTMLHSIFKAIDAHEDSVLPVTDHGGFLCW